MPKIRIPLIETTTQLWPPAGKENGLKSAGDRLRIDNQNSTHREVPFANAA